jgi:hypothetical protein
VTLQTVIKTTKKTIPSEEQENVIDMFWVLLTSLEGKCEDTDILDKRDVESGYNILNRIGYTTARPRWEKK